MKLKQLRKIFKPLLDLIFPPKCQICSSIDFDSRYGFLCSDCSGKFHALQEPLCTVCGKPFSSPITSSHVCATCLHDGPPFKTARSAGILEGSLLDAVKKFKYSHVRAMYKPLVEFTFANLHEYLISCRADVVVPVPCHVKKLRQRGFHH